MGLKLLDIPMLADERVFYFDSDIRFFQNFSCERISNLQTTHFIFMEDLRQGYSARLVDLIYKHGLRMSSKVNAGAWSSPRARYDPGFIEWFLSIPEFRIFPQLVEQTCWAAMSAGNDVSLLDPSQIRCTDGPGELDAETLGLHFIAGAKQCALVSPEAKFELKIGASRTLRLIPAKPLTIGRLLAHTVGRRLLRFMK